jgi:hypothetical protein
VEQLLLELAGEAGERRVVEMERLQDDCGAARECGGDALDVDRRGDRNRTPREIDRVLADGEVFLGLDQAKSRVTEPGGCDEALGLLDG